MATKPTIKAVEQDENRLVIEFTLSEQGGAGEAPRVEMEIDLLKMFPSPADAPAREEGETRRGLRGLIEETFSRARTREELESDLSAVLYSGGGFGLDERTSRSLAKREAAMLAGGMKPKDVKREMRQLRDGALQGRASLIAQAILECDRSSVGEHLEGVDQLADAILDRIDRGDL